MNILYRGTHSSIDELTTNVVAQMRLYHGARIAVLLGDDIVLTRPSDTKEEVKARLETSLAFQFVER